MEYRREIDGVRALAVIPVVLFHAGFELFGGGFVGVDVFFVISGYLITSIIISEHENRPEGFSLVYFYERRARRILPALFLVMLVCIPLAWIWLLPDDMKRFSQSLVAVSSFSSNILFWQTSGYFETATELKPLLHTWSLAVEEQFYLFFPLLLMLIWRWGKGKVTATLLALSVASLALAQWSSTHAPDSAFYLLPSRGWELLLGALLALHGSSFSKVRKTQWIAETGSALGLAMVLYATFAFDQQTPFPSAYTLVPTAGTGLLIVFATSHTLVGRVLGTNIFVGLGLISYSAYLWHQPLLAFARHRSLDHPTAALLSAIVLLTFVLAFLTWKFVEAPFRSKEGFTRNQVFTGGAFFSLIFIAFGVFGHVSQGFMVRHESFERLSNIGTERDSYCHTKGRRTASQLAMGEFCIVGAGKHPTIAVIGDSHAGALFPALGEQLQDKAAFVALSGGFCAPLSGYKLTRFAAEDCAETTDAALHQIIQSDVITEVVLVAQWANYTSGYRDNGNGTGTGNLIALAADTEGSARLPAENAPVFERSLRRTIKMLRDADKSVTIVMPLPEFDRRVLRTVGKLAFFDLPASLYPVTPQDEYVRRNLDVMTAFSRLKDVSFIETADLFCSANTCHSVGESGNVLFSDTNHVTEHGARLVSARLIEQLGI